MPAFDAEELTRLKNQTKIIRKKRFARSRLDKHSAKLLSLYKKAGASVAELQRWLRANRIKVEHSTVHSVVRQNGLPKMANSPPPRGKPRLCNKVQQGDTLQNHRHSQKLTNGHSPESPNFTAK